MADAQHKHILSQHTYIACPLAPETTSDLDCKIPVEFETPLFQLLKVRIAGLIQGHIKMFHV